MAGLGTDDQKSAAHATTPIATAFKICIMATLARCVAVPAVPKQY